MSKQNLLDLTEEDLALIKKFEKIAQNNLKKGLKGAVLAMDYIWNKLMQNANIKPLNIIVKSGRVSNWSELMDEQIQDLPKVFHQSEQLLKADQGKEKQYQTQIEELTKENERLKLANLDLNNSYNLLEEKYNLAVTPENENLQYLKERSLMLAKLESFGVDNWEGYEEAINSEGD